MEVRRYEVLSTCEHLTHLKQTFPKRCLATVSNNSANTSLLFVCDQYWPTGSARTHADVSVKWPNIRLQISLATKLPKNSKT